MFLKNHINRIIRTLGVKVIYDPNFESNGFYVSSLNIIFINSNLSEFSQQEILLHELGHASKHKNNQRLYDLSFSLRSKMENEAECFMIENLIDNYVSNIDFDISTVNFVDFMDYYKIDIRFEPFVKKSFYHLKDSLTHA